MEENDGQLPTFDEIRGIWHYAEEENEEHTKLLLWYVDRFLPVCAGKEFYGEKIRHYLLPSSKVDLFNKKVTAVTVTSEAFGQLLYANCRNKWMKIYRWKKANPGKKLPTKGKAAQPFLGKYTNSKNGQVANGGWSTEGLLLFEVLKRDLQEFREEDENNGYLQQKLALKLMRNQHEIEDTSPNKKKRKRNGDGSPESDGSTGRPAKVLTMEEE